MAKDGADRMAQVTHRTELILTFEKMYFGTIFGIKVEKIAHVGFRTDYLSVRWIL